MNILVVEDEPKVAELLKKGLEEAGYTVDLAYDGIKGYQKALSEHYDLLLLDVILPGMNGMSLSKKIRKTNIFVPILMLSALGTSENKVEGFDSGADDYLAKPFDFNELLARIKALIKRTGTGNKINTVIKVHDLELDLGKKLARRGDHTIELTGKEFSLLEFLIRNKGNIVTRSDIALKVWDITFDTGTNIVDVYINILRKKIDKGFPKKLIQTRIGMGYYIEAD